MEFPSGYRKRSGGGRCCVPNCQSVRRKSDNLSFHTVPNRNSVQKVERKNVFGHSEFVNKRDEWLRILNVKDDRKELLVCSLHFLKDDYSFPDLDAKFRVLKKKAVPQCPKSNSEKILGSVKRKRQNKAREVKKKKAQNPEESSEENLINETEGCNESQDKATQVTSADFNDTAFSGERLQVTTTDSQLTLCSFIKTEKDLKIICNIESFKLLNELIKLMDEMYPAQKKYSFTTCDCIVLTTAKFNLDISFAVLAVFMKCACEETIRNVFYDTLNKLSTILQSTLTTFSKEEIERDIPMFINKFNEITSILDCMEIKIEKVET